MFERRRINRAPWEDITGDKEVDLVIAALRGIEIREGERRGWDQPGRLYTLHRLHPDFQMLGARLITPRLWDNRPGHPVDNLAAYATRVVNFVSSQLGHGPPTEFRRLSFNDTPDGIAAVALMHEAWKVHPDNVTDDEQRRREAGERVLHNNPHRVEVRIIAAYDINGNGFYIERENGEAATRVRAQSMIGERLDPHEPDEADTQFGGLAHDCLFSLAIAARTGIWPGRGPSAA